MAAMAVGTTPPSGTPLCMANASLPTNAHQANPIIQRGAIAAVTFETSSMTTFAGIAHSRHSLMLHFYFWRAKQLIETIRLKPTMRIAHVLTEALPGKNYYLILVSFYQPGEVLSTSFTPTDWPVRWVDSCIFAFN